MKYNEHLKSLPTCDVVATGTTPNLELRICPHSQCVYECKKPVESNAKKRHHWRSDDAEKHLLRPHRMVQVTDLSLQRLFAHANIVLLSCLASTTRTMGAATRMEVAAKAYERRCDAPDVTISWLPLYIHPKDSSTSFVESATELELDGRIYLPVSQKHAQRIAHSETPNDLRSVVSLWYGWSLRPEVRPHRMNHFLAYGGEVTESSGWGGCHFQRPA